MGIGDWGLGIGDWAQSPIPNPQSPIPNPHILNIIIIKNNKIIFTKKLLKNKLNNYSIYLLLKKIKIISNLTLFSFQEMKILKKNKYLLHYIIFI